MPNKSETICCIERLIRMGDSHRLQHGVHSIFLQCISCAVGWSDLQLLVIQYLSPVCYSLRNVQYSQSSCLEKVHALEKIGPFGVGTVS